MNFKSLVSRLTIPKFGFIYKNFSNRSFSLLDIGAGNQSASKTKRLFPNCNYSGLDLNKLYANSAEDFKVMDHFYELDLTKLDYSSIPDNHFDCIIISHVIEHLFNGDEVVALLIQKLKVNGVIYVEYPGIKSTKLPSMYGTLNFKDDPTHVRLYSVKELKGVFEKVNCEVIKSGTRRNYYCIAAIPLRVFVALVKRQKIAANVFWDLLGFAEFLEARRKQ